MFLFRYQSGLQIIIQRKWKLRSQPKLKHLLNGRLVVNFLTKTTTVTSTGPHVFTKYSHIIIYHPILLWELVSVSACVCAHRKAAGRRIINYNVKVRSVNLGRARRKIESVVWGLADFVLRDLEKYQNYIEISLSGVLLLLLLISKRNLGLPGLPGWDSW